MFKTMFTITLFSLVVSGCNWFQDSSRSQSQEADPANRSVSTDNAEAMGNKKCPPKSGRVGDMKPCKLKITDAKNGNGQPLNNWKGFRFEFSEVNNNLQVNIKEAGCPNGPASGSACNKIPRKIGNSVRKPNYYRFSSGQNNFEYFYRAEEVNNQPVFHCLAILMQPQPMVKDDDFNFFIFQIKSTSDINELKCIPHDHAHAQASRDKDTPSGGGRKGVFLDKSILTHILVSGGGRYSN